MGASSTAMRIRGKAHGNLQLALDRSLARGAAATYGAAAAARNPAASYRFPGLPRQW